MKKKVLATLLALSLLISLFSGITAFASAKTLNVTLAAVSAADPLSTTVNPGDTVTVTIGTGSWSGLVGGIVGAEFNVSYDTTRLTYNSIDLASGQANGSRTKDLTGSDASGVVHVLYFDNSGSQFYPLSAGDAFVLSFTVKADAPDGSAAISVADVDAANNSWVDADTDTSLQNVGATYPSATSVTIATPPTDPITSWGTYLVQGTKIMGLSGYYTGTDAATFVSGLTIASNASVKVKGIDGLYMYGAETNDSACYAVGSGTLLEVYQNGTLVNTYTILIRGDVDGNGIVDLDDFFAIFDVFLSSQPLANLTTFEDATIVGDLDGVDGASLDDMFLVFDYFLSGDPIDQTFPVV